MATTYEISTGFAPAKYEVITGTGSTTYGVVVGGRGPAGEDGATEWNQLEGTLDVLPFTTTNGGPQNLGELAWTQADETLSLQLAHGTILQLGEETLYHVENVTGSTIANGTPVSYAGTVGNSGKMRVKPWNGATDDPLIFMGIATSDIETDDAGYVTHFGKVRGINTNAYTAGAVLYANPSGTGLTMTQPTTGQYVIAAVCISSANNGTMFVRPTRYGGANWDAIGGKPSTFTPSAHTHPTSEISDSTSTGRSLMTAANASAARTTLELGNAALATTSTGGNGSADSGKVLAFGAGGEIRASFYVLSGTSGNSTLLGTNLTSAKIHQSPNADGTYALTASASGVPDNIAPPLDKTTPIDADEVVIRDSAASFVAKRLTFANLWTWITTKLGGNLTIGGTKTWSGQQQATGQSATNGESLMTRNLGDTRFLLNNMVGTYRWSNQVTAYLATNTGTGTFGGLSDALELNTGATAGSVAFFRSNAFSIRPWHRCLGTGRSIVNWSLRTVHSAKIHITDITGADTVVRILIGQPYDNTTAKDFSASEKGIGFKIIDGILSVQVANATAVSTTSTGQMLTSLYDYDIVLDCDGAGNWICYLNGTSVATGTGAPTGTSTTRHNALCGSITNGTTAASRRFYIVQQISMQIT